MKKIILMRHGRVVADMGRKVSPQEFPAWVASYDRSGIDQEMPPGCSTLNMIKAHDAIVCSGLRRSLDSARLCHKEPLERNPLFDEAGIPASLAPFPRLNPRILAFLFRTAWRLGYSKNCESYAEAMARAGLAAGRLAELTETHGAVLLMGHGIMNRLIAKQLKRQGWHTGRGLRYDHWDYGVFEKRR